MQIGVAVTIAPNVCALFARVCSTTILTTVTVRMTAKPKYSTPSPSALALVDMCEARAGARYIEGLKEPEGAKAALGTRCHSIASDYLSKGTAPNRAETFEIPNERAKQPTVFYPGRIVWNVLPHLPPAGSVPDVERKISLEWSGIKFHEKSSIDWETNAGPGDHKFTTDVQYAKTSEQLRTDPQVIIYSADWFQRHDADEAVFQHTYGQFDCKASKKVLTHVTRASVAQLMDEVIVPKAEKLLGWVAQGVNWRSLPKNTAACGTYKPHGCPYARECPRSSAEKRQMVRHALGFAARSANGTEEGKQISMSSFMEKLRAKKAAAAAAANTNSEHEAPVEQPVSEPEVESQDIEHDAEEAAAALAGHINPPGEAGDVIDVKEPEQHDTANEHRANGTAAPAAEEPKKRRGRPTGSKNKAAVPATNLEKQLAASVEANETAQESIDPGTADAQAWRVVPLDTESPKPITMLLIDCFIARGLNDVIHASDLIAQAHNHIKSTYNVLDYRAGGVPELEYGKGPGILAACIEGLVQDLPLGSVVLLDTRSPEGQVALQPLVAASISVIRGAA